MINNFIKQVSEFHKAFGIEKGNVNTQLRYDLFLEEFNEYKDAKDLVEKTDAICDMMYIACGTLDVHEHKYEYEYDEDIRDNEETTLEYIDSLLELYRIQGNAYEMEMIIPYILDLAYHNNILDILPELFTAVQESNLSKLDDNGKPIINELNSEYYDSRKPLGKVLKSKNFFEPKLKEILIKYNKI